MHRQQLPTDGIPAQPRQHFVSAQVDQAYQQVDTVSAFTLNPSATPGTHLYELRPTTHHRKVANPTGQAYPLDRRPPTLLGLVMGLALLVTGSSLFLVLGLFDRMPSVASRMVLLTSTQTDGPTISNLLALQLDVVTPLSAPTVSCWWAVPTPTLMPTLTPTPPSFTATPTSIAPTQVPTPQHIVLQMAVVCGNPCSCSPVARTISRGTQVTVLDRTACKGDFWYQIGEKEWLGPRLVDEEPKYTLYPRAPQRTTLLARVMPFATDYSRAGCRLVRTAGSRPRRVK